jgi:hypothetical protein
MAGARYNKTVLVHIPWEEQSVAIKHVTLPRRSETGLLSNDGRSGVSGPGFAAVILYDDVLGTVDSAIFILLMCFP